MPATGYFAKRYEIRVNRICNPTQTHADKPYSRIIKKKFFAEATTGVPLLNVIKKLPSAFVLSMPRLFSSRVKPEWGYETGSMVITGKAHKMSFTLF
jgi:hypothetical protein